MLIFHFQIMHAHLCINEVIVTGKEGYLALE